MNASRRSLLLSATGAMLRNAPARPNLVLFLSDDHGYFDSSVYGSRVVRTPNLEALAREGMAFTHAFTSSPTCVPSRANLMSGLYPARNGALPNHSGLTAGVKTLPSFLKEAGYEVFHFGKSHFQPAVNYRDWTSVPSEIKRGPLTSDLDTDLLERWLSERAGQRRQSPVCLIICSHSPHVYWRENEGYDPARVELPPTFVDTPETRRERTKYYSDITFADRQLGETVQACRRHLSRNTLFIYTSDNGAQWPLAKWSLYDAGIRLPFIASWPGVIAGGGRSDAMISFVDLLPTWVELAGGKKPEGLDGRSFAALLRGDTRSHRGAVYAAHSGDRDFNVYPCRALRTAKFKYILNLRPEFKYTTHIDVAGADDGRAYFDTWVEKAKTDKAAAAKVERYHRRPAEELYDMTADPHETRNLASELAYAPALREMRGKVQAWMKQQGDTGPVFGRPRLLDAR